MIEKVIPLAVLAFLGGCAGMGTPAYECGLEEAPHAKCASMEQAYAAAKRVDPKQKATSVFDSKAPVESQQDTKPFFRGADSEFPETGQQGMPVFAQPKVHRVWVGPYVDADGNLRTGEYTYFNTPGKWNYGSTKATGAASGVYGPAKPGSLGFTPVDKAKVATPAPAKPPGSTIPAVTLSPSTGGKGGDIVTQPYQKILD
jgi:type IV conjugative transfer system lipoprotein TraV